MFPLFFFLVFFSFLSFFFFPQSSLVATALLCGVEKPVGCGVVAGKCEGNEGLRDAYLKYSYCVSCLCGVNGRWAKKKRERVQCQCL